MPPTTSTSAPGAASQRPGHAPKAVGHVVGNAGQGRRLHAGRQRHEHRVGERDTHELGQRPAPVAAQRPHAVGGPARDGHAAAGVAGRAGGAGAAGDLERHDHAIARARPTLTPSPTSSDLGHALVSEREGVAGRDGARSGRQRPGRTSPPPAGARAPRRRPRARALGLAPLDRPLSGDLELPHERDATPNGLRYSGSRRSQSPTARPTASGSVRRLWLPATRATVAPRAVGRHPELV